MSKKIKNMTQIAVIGLGRFGVALVKSLVDQGKEVLAIDSNETSVNLVTDFATATVVADATDENVLEAVDITKFDAVVVCIGENLQSSALITLICKQMGVPFIIAKASNLKHKTILEKIGADVVVVPELESAKKLANTFSHPSLSEVYELTKSYMLVEILANEKWYSKTLMEIDFRKKYGVNVILIKRNGEVIINPDGQSTIFAEDVLVVGGTIKDIDILCDSIEQ